MIMMHVLWTSTISTILKQNDALKGKVTPAKGVSIISKMHTPVINTMERSLLKLICEKQLAGDTNTQAAVLQVL